MRVRCVSLLVSTFALFAGCSFQGLDRYELPVCASNDDCEITNRVRNIPAEACMRFRCVIAPDQRRERVCRLAARDFDGDGDPAMECGGSDCDDRDRDRSTVVLDENGAQIPRVERCDGADNNCNSIIDEGAYAGAAATLGAVASGSEPIRAARAANGSIAVAVSSREQPTVSRFLLSDGTRLESEASVAMRTTNDASRPFSSYTPSATGQCLFAAGASACSLLDAALVEVDAATSRWAVLGVNTLMCTAGQLRVAAWTPGSMHAEQLGPPLRSNFAHGVGTSTYPVYEPRSGALVSGTCTGANTGRSALGAARPSVQALGSITVPRSGPHPSLSQALAVWRGRPAAADACMAPNAPVEAMGIWPESSSAGGTQLHWFNGSGTGRPETLGASRGDAPVSIAAIATPPGFIVAFATPSDEIALRFVAAVDTSVVLPSSSIPTEAANGAAETVRTTPALSVVDLGSFRRSGAASVDDVSIALADPGTPQRAGITWQEGCGTGTRRVYFARVEFDPMRAASVRETGTIQLGSDAAEHPALAYATTGFVALGFARNGMTVAPNSDGGWVVAWLDGRDPVGSVATQRVLELDAQPIDPSPLALMTERSVALRRVAMTNGPIAGSAPVRLAVQSVGQLSTANLLCAPAR